MNRIAACLLAFFILFLPACAGPGEKAVLRIGAGDAPNEDNRRVMFPSESAEEIPRYVYVGQLVGEANFVTPEPQKDTFGGVLRWIAGLLVGDDKPTVLQRPQSGVVDATGRVLVTDISRQAVFVFDEAQGKLLVWEQAIGLQKFVSPVGIALGADDDIYVTDPELALVVHLDREGRPLGVIGRNMLQRPTGVAFDPVRKRLYVADTRASDIKVFDESGTLISVFGERGDGKGSLSFPTFLALRGETLYVSDTMNARIQLLSAETGEYLDRVGARGMYVGNLVRPKGVALDGEGNLYVVESYHDHLLVYNRDGDFLMSIGGGAGKSIGQYYLPSGVWTDTRNRVYLADTFNGRVVVYQFLGGGAEGER
jgi:DNA-binding beta-propeller fold protein YncE